MSDRKSQSTPTSNSPSSNSRRAVNPSRTTSTPDSKSNSTRPSKSKKNKSSSSITTATTATPSSSSPSRRQQQQSQSQSRRKSSSPSHSHSSRRYRRQLTHQPSQQTLFNDYNSSTYSNDDDTHTASPTTPHGNIDSKRFDFGASMVLAPLTIPQGVHMSDTCTREGQRTTRSPNQGSSRSQSRTGSVVVPASPSPPSMAHSEEGGLPKVIALKQTEVRAWVRRGGRRMNEMNHTIMEAWMQIPCDILDAI